MVNKSQLQKASVKWSNPFEGRLRHFYQEAQARLEKSLNPIDGKNIGKLHECAEYAEGIFAYLRERQNGMYARQECLKSQGEVNDKVRAGVVDWMVEVQGKHELQPETLYLSVNILDRYLEKEKVSKNKLQLVALAALMIAAKYEEIYPPTPKDLIRSLAKSCMKEELLSAETSILQKLKFELSLPSIGQFVDRYSRLLAADDTLRCLALYLAEIQMLDCKMLKFPPSQLAAAGLYLAHKLLGRGTPFNDLLAKQAKLTESQVLLCAKEMLAFAQVHDKSSFHAIKKKYSSAKLKLVASIKLDYSLAF